MISYAEAPRVEGLTPDDFKATLENFAEEYPKFNDLASSVTTVDSVEGKDVLKVVLDFPWPLWNRLMVTVKYVQLNEGDGKDSHLLILSEEGNQDLLGKHVSADDRKNFVIARNFLTAWLIKPISDDSGTVIGSRVQYLASLDVGGSVPSFVQDSQTPDTAYDSVFGLVQHVKAKK